MFRGVVLEYFLVSLGHAEAFCLECVDVGEDFILRHVGIEHFVLVYAVRLEVCEHNLSLRLDFVHAVDVIDGCWPLAVFQVSACRRRVVGSVARFTCFVAASRQHRETCQTHKCENGFLHGH